MAGRGQKLGDGRSGDGGGGRGPVEVAVDRLERINAVGEDGHLLAARHELGDICRFPLDLDAGFEVVVSEEAVRGESVILAIEALVLNEAETAGLEEAVRRVEVLDCVACG